MKLLIPDPTPIIETVDEVQLTPHAQHEEEEEFVPDTCSNCPESGHCPAARDTFNGNRRN